ncbi:hypothetical protein MANES_18G060500v8 [Manihot esculenta]|uniref:Uncharacterized protein n=1 Tax=Manihot esculenta TaxID=3983 RepID=A0ACB7FY18_MANES|nr:hypothetical protein MANES_18G060500v8 [Manihot esculenta]
MEIAVSSSSNFVDLENRKNKAEEDRDRIRVKRETLKAVLEQCQRALQLLGNNTDGVDEVNDDDNDNDNDNDRGKPAVEDDDDKELSRNNSVASPGAADREAYELCDLLKSRVGCPDFLEKLECDYMLVPQNLSEEGSSWDMVSESDLWEAGIVDSDQEDYVLVRQEDLVEGIACFMAAYLLSFRQANVRKKFFLLF